MNQADYGITYEMMVVSPLTTKERLMLRNAKNLYNGRTGKKLTNREYRKKVLLEGAVRELTGAENDESNS